jgi:hypothetical protein
MVTMSIDDEIRKAEDRLVKLQEKKVEEDNKLKRLVIDYHTAECNVCRRGESCGWIEEIDVDGNHQWNGTSHTTWFSQVADLLRVYTAEDIQYVINLKINSIPQLLQSLKRVDRREKVF